MRRADIIKTFTEEIKGIENREEMWWYLGSVGISPRDKQLIVSFPYDPYSVLSFNVTSHEDIISIISVITNVNRIANYLYEETMKQPSNIKHLTNNTTVALACDIINNKCNSKIENRIHTEVSDIDDGDVSFPIIVDSESGISDVVAEISTLADKLESILAQIIFFVADTKNFPDCLYEKGYSHINRSSM